MHQNGAVKTALLVMDVQVGIVERYGGDGSLTTRLQHAIEAARRSGVLVIYVVVGFRDDYAEVSPNNAGFSAIARTGAYTSGDPKRHIHPDVAPRPGDVIVTKKRVGAFAGSDLAMVLRAQHIEALVLTGISTSGVVLSTARHAADLDFRLTILSDGCTDGDREVHELLLNKVLARQATVVGVEEWIAGLADEGDTCAT